MIATQELQIIEVERIERLSEELKAEGRKDDASAIATLLAVVTHADTTIQAKKSPRNSR